MWNTLHHCVNIPNTVTSSPVPWQTNLPHKSHCRFVTVALLVYTSPSHPQKQYSWENCDDLSCWWSTNPTTIMPFFSFFCTMMCLEIDFAIVECCHATNILSYASKFAPQTLCCLLPLKAHLTWPVLQELRRRKKAWYWNFFGGCSKSSNVSFCSFLFSLLISIIFPICLSIKIGLNNGCSQYSLRIKSASLYKITILLDFWDWLISTETLQK